MVVATPNYQHTCMRAHVYGGAKDLLQPKYSKQIKDNHSDQSILGGQTIYSTPFIDGSQMILFSLRISGNFCSDNTNP